MLENGKEFEGLDSYESALYKFGGTTPYSKAGFHWFETPSLYQKSIHELDSGNLIGVYIPASNSSTTFDIHGKLIEVVQYEDGSSHVFMIKSESKPIQVKWPTGVPLKLVSGVSLVFICTADEPYFSMLQETLAWYREFLPSNFELSVVMFGDAALPSYVRTRNFPIEMFHMAFARNQSLLNASYDHVFMLDADVRISKSQIDSILNKFHTIPSDGVFNLKNSRTLGNGLYFGDRHKMIQNGFNEQFKKYWGEDTEFLMNFSRLGTIPVVVFEPFERLDHIRPQTIYTVFTAMNTALMTEIILRGRRYEL